MYGDGFGDEEFLVIWRREGWGRNVRGRGFNGEWFDEEVEKMVLIFVINESVWREGF